MKILSYNVNGIRAALKKGFTNWLESTNADVICLQETKALEEQVDTDEIKNIGYNLYWFSANKKGYSGVAIFTKLNPQEVSYGSGIKHIDFEGRIIRVDFENVSIMSLYLPSGTNIDRLEYKFRFIDDFYSYID